MAPPSDECENYVACLKLQSLSKKSFKLRPNRPINGNAIRVRTMHPSNARRSGLRAWQKKLETKASSTKDNAYRQDLVSVHREWCYLLYMSIISMRSRRFPANTASDCLRFAKFWPQFSESWGATYTRICEMFGALQRKSCPVTYFENSVQIDS